jgi:hypothetical protein
MRLTSCVCKTMERMVNRRLVWILENKNLLYNVQCGFQWHRSTLYHLVTLENRIRNSFLVRQHLVAFFCDLEKAYDTTWRYGILRTLHRWNLRRLLPLFISSFLQDRHFRVRLGTVFSDFYTQENGVPQGSVLSVTFFAVAINGLVNVVDLSVTIYLYVDVAVYYSSRSVVKIERRLRFAINRLSFSALHHLSA